jgi:DNA-binding XRE family transcriptional regulator
LTAEELASTMANHGIGTVELAREVSVNRTTVMRWAKGESPMSGPVLFSLKHGIKAILARREKAKNC